MAIFKHAKSCEFIRKYGIFHYLSISTALFTSEDYLKIYGELFFLDKSILNKMIKCKYFSPED